MVAVAVAAALASPASASPPIPASAKGKDAPLHYIGSVELLPEDGVLLAGWTIVVADSTRDSLDLLLSGDFGTASVSGPGVAAMSHKPDEDGRLRRYSIALSPPQGGSDRIVKISYGGRFVPGPMPINTVDPRKIELTVDSFWFPFDARYDTRITADVQLRVDGTWTALGAGEMAPTPKGHRLVQADPGLDVALVLLADPVEARRDEAAIYDARTEAGSRIDALLAAVDGCRAYLNGLAGPAGPLPSTQLVVTDRADGGWSRGALIALTDIENEDEEALRQLVCHELAHHWSRANAGGPDNWINEGVADHLANMAVRHVMGEDIYRARLARYREQLKGAALPPIWRPGATDRPPHLVLYRAAPLALADLEDRMGREGFAAFMSALMAVPPRGTDDFLEALERQAGPQLRDGFAAQLARQTIR
ncbi:MAG: hypothetical protein AAF311_00505 [Pseudomonadota bacterium]